jgi:hypothetical protein
VNADTTTQEFDRGPSERQAESSFWFSLVFYLLSFFLCYVAYRNVVNNYLFNDDFLWISSARYEMQIGNLFSYRVIGFFRPLINLSFFIMEKVAPGNFPQYYYQNILFHYLNAILVFHLILSLLNNRIVAATTAVFFIVASFHTGAVYWISARTTLISTLFLLSSLVLLTRQTPSRRTLTFSLILFGLALLAKETAIVGVPLVGLLYLFFRTKDNATFYLRTLLSLTAITLIYLIVRSAVIGTFVQPNWAPGVHVARNIVGGGVYQLLPWVAETLLIVSQEYLSVGKPVIASTITSATHPIWPEILIVPQLLFLILIAWKAKKLRGMLFAITWMFVCLIPSSLLTFRFLTINSFAHDRYYYLPSIGACMAMVLMLSPLWESKRIKKFGTVIATVVLFVVFSAETLRLKYMEQKWGRTTMGARKGIEVVIQRLEQLESFTTCAVENPPLKFRYFKNAILLERPGWNIVHITNGQAEALQHQPCIYLIFEIKERQVYMQAIRLDGSSQSP